MGTANIFYELKRLDKWWL